MKNKGFTLVELLVVISISGVVMVILSQIFFSSLRGNNKAQVLAIIKQNGQNVIDTFDKNIRNADNVVCVSNTGRTLVIVKNGTYTRYSFIYGNQTSNGDIWQDNPTPELSEKNPNDFVNRVCGIDMDKQPADSSHIIDNLASGVFVTSGNFTRDLAVGFKEIVNITFELQPSIESAKKILGIIDPVKFDTSVGLR